MAEPYQDDDYYQHTGAAQSRVGKKTPSTSQVIALATLVPFGASLLILAGLTLAATVIGLTLTAPLFVLFSPVLLPAALLIALAVAGFVTSGAFGVTSVSSFAWLANYLRRTRLLERLKQPIQEGAEYVVHRAEEAVEFVENKAEQMGQEAQIDLREEAEKAQTESDAREPEKAQTGSKYRKSAQKAQREAAKA